QPAQGRELSRLPAPRPPHRLLRSRAGADRSVARPSGRRMTALHLVKTGVGAAWALAQMSELVRRGVRVHVAVPQGPMAARYRAAGVTVHLIDLDFPARAPWRLL